MNILEEIKRVRQSLWLDSLNRDMLFNGSLPAMIRELGVTGITSNPSIFEAAIIKSSRYNETMDALAAKGTPAAEIFEILAVEDIQRAADFFKPIYEETAGTDGFVSIEVNPALAHDGPATVREGERLFKKIGRANVMIKVPATPQGVQAGHALLKKGVNINFTLIFSPERYEEVMKAYIDALAWRAENDLPVNAPASVASFFVSRIDTAVDDEIDLMTSADDSFDDEELYDFANSARGRAAIANSLTAYGRYALVFSSAQFDALRAQGAKKQRLLWASTGVKNPAYKDTMYCDALLLPDTVNTLPQAALKAFVDHGAPDRTPLKERLATAGIFLGKLVLAGVDLRAILEYLENDGVEKFSHAHDAIISHIEERTRTMSKQELSEARTPVIELPAGDFGQAVTALREKDFAGRLWQKDASLWKSEPEHVKIIGNSLGWLDAPFKMLGRVKEINAFRDEIIKEGFSSVVLLGMGGSSLAPEVIRSAFQNQENPRLYVLDTTDPAWILGVKEKLNVKKTLFLFASKSGGTIEPSSQFKYFWSLLKKAGVKKPGNSFAAITDPGTGLEKLAKEKKFRKIFTNFADIGGRFSALSYFGMVPAALCGADVQKLLERAIDCANMCKDRDINKNPGALLGALIGDMALKGRDKLTLIMPKQLELFGLWVEQLVAESTGKEGNRGVVPVCMEELSEPDNYQNDRFFVHTQLGSLLDAVTAAKLGRIKMAGQPVCTIFMHDVYDLGAEFFRWEAATAAAGSLMAINPFDQPNVKEAKDLTLKALEALISKEKTPAVKPVFSSDKMAVYASKALRADAKDGERVLSGFLSALKPGEYAALLAYLPNTLKVEQELKKLRENIKARTGAATTLSYGPRYLHSSGQLHKGGPDKGVFVILTNQAQNDISITGEKYTFWQLEMAQAMGDFEALDSKNRRVLRVHLKHPLDRSIRRLNERLVRAGNTEKTTVDQQGEESNMLKLNTKKNTAAKPAAKTKLTTKNENEYVLIDHPRNLENITSRHYAVRVSVSGAAGLDISIDDAPWQSCRHSVGYWWFDWTNFTPGTHQLVARMRTHNGEYLISKRRRCKVS